MRRDRSYRLCWVIILALSASIHFLAFQIKDGKAGLDSLTYMAPELRIVETPEDFRMIKEGFATSEGIAKFLLENNSSWTATVDVRRGVTTLLDGGAIPFIPGPANSLAWESFGADCRSIRCISRDKIELLSREFLDKYAGLFPVKQEELVMDPDGTIPIGESFYLVRFRWVVNHIPVEGASIFFRINNGNLLQVASTNIAPLTIDTTPRFTPETAWQILNDYLGEYRLSEKDEILESGELVIIPTTVKGLDTETYTGTVGGMSSYNLAYRLVFSRPDIQGTWEALIDAHTGEMLRFVDINRYGRIHGGIRASDGLPPEEDRSFPYADTGLASPNDYSDQAGMFTGNNATTTLTGKYTHILDYCGSISNTTTTGDLDFLTDLAAGTDCVVPAGNTGGPGNTHSSRTLFFNLTAIHMKAQSFNPSNTWLTTGYVIAKVNDFASCNASSAGINSTFHKQVAGTCNNLGEIPGVAMHEWAHMYDTNDGSGGITPPLETYADWTAIIQTHNSCIGAGVFIGNNCSGYGDACTDCTGIRDCDYAKHAANTPWTSANHGSTWNCTTGSYNGPCGWEDHCESGISSQALWDFVHRDLVTECGMDLASAWMLEDRLWFTGVPTLTASYTCSGGITNGCAGTVLYNVMRALDDDGDGTANGTPHAHAIYHALHRHLLDCSTYNDSSPQNQNQTSCPALTIPALSSAIGDNQVTLNWSTGGANTVRYFIYRNESGCDAVFNKIATVAAPTLTFTDSACSNGVTYRYRVQAATLHDSCVSLSSNCVTATPEPCRASMILNRTGYSCASTISVNVLDSTPGPEPWQGEAWSASDSEHRTFSLAGTEQNLAGSFTTSAGAGGAGVVHVADGDTLTVRFVDPDNCGGGSLYVDRTAAIDCSGPIISDVMVADVTGNSATIEWTTSESANSRLTYGTSLPPGTDKEDLITYTTDHSVLVNGLAECTQYFFSVTSTDATGNSTTDNNGGSYHTFTTEMNVNPTYVSTDVPLAIPDLTTVVSAIPVADNKTIQKVVVTLGNITHTYDSDLDIYLIAPDNTRVELTTDNGSSGDNYINTVFDDSSVSSITNGTAPFTGTFKPEGSLAALIGKNAAGTWKLEVSDDSSSDTGTLNSWSITFTYPAQSCGPSLAYQGNTFTDVCYGTGTGGENTYIDPGEDVTIQLALHNNGTSGTTMVTGTLSTSTPGITVTDGDASFPDIEADGTGTSISNHFAFHVDGSVVCGTVVDFNVHMSCSENPAGWDSTFTMAVGNVVPGTLVTDFSENFNAVSVPNLPAGWTRSKTSGNDWTTDTSGCSGNSLTYPYNSSQEANSWAYTPPVSLTSGVVYTVGFNQKVGDSRYPEKMSVTCGTAATPAEQTITIMAEQTYTNTACTARSYTFTVPATGTYYLAFHCTSAVDMYNLDVDDVLLTHATPPDCTVAACLPSCTPPSTPTIDNITDKDECQSGVIITFTPGNPSAVDALLVDSVETASGISSPFTHDPGDTASHSYRIRSYSEAGCPADSTSVPATDSGIPSRPVITGISDPDPLNQTGISITYTAGTPATRHDLYMDGLVVAFGYLSGALFDPGDSHQHAYFIRAFSAPCQSDSNVQPGTDYLSTTIIPEEIASGSSPVDSQSWSADKTIQSWPSDGSATGYRLYMGTRADLAGLLNSSGDSCTRFDGAGTDIDLSADDPSLTEGRFFWYLVTAYNLGGEGSSGGATAGLRIVNSSGVCP